MTLTMTIFIHRRPLAALSLAVLPLAALTACGGLIETDYQRPDTATPAAWTGDATSGAAPAQTVLSSAWWRAFNEPELDALVTQAFAANTDLAVSAVKIRRARLQASLTADGLNPQPSLSGNAQVSAPFRGKMETTRTFSVQAGVSYEADLWGKLDRDWDAARWEAQATEEDRESAAQSLAGTTATLYWQSVYLTQRLAITQESIAYARRTLDLVQIKRQSGASSPLEVAEAEQNLESQLAGLSDLEQQRSEAKTALALLFGGAPQSVGPVITRLTLPGGDMPPVDAGLPADLLRRRPDIRAAELRLRGTLAGVDSTRASYLPSLSLTGSAGSSDVALVNVLRNPLGALGAGLALPFLRWNEMNLSIRVSKTEYEQAVLEFRQTLYNALGDVENALSARSNLSERADHLEKSLAAARQAERLYEIRYRAGAVALQNWLDAQEKRRAAEESLLANRYDRLANQITLYQSLGGDSVLGGTDQSAVPTP